MTVMTVGKIESQGDRVLLYPRSASTSPLVFENCTFSTTGPCLEPSIRQSHIVINVGDNIEVTHQLPGGKFQI